MSENITLLMGIGSFVGSLFVLYGAAVKKQYASERDFNHLKRNYENLNVNVGALSDLIDRRLDGIELTLTKIEMRQSVRLDQASEPKKEG